MVGDYFLFFRLQPWLVSFKAAKLKPKIKVGLTFKMYIPFKWGWKEVQVIGVYI